MLIRFSPWSAWLMCSGADRQSHGWLRADWRVLLQPLYWRLQCQVGVFSSVFSLSRKTTFLTLVLYAGGHVLDGLYYRYSRWCLILKSKRQSSQLTEPLLADPDLKSGIRVWELISTLEEVEKMKHRQGMNGQSFSQNPHKWGESHHHKRSSFTWNKFYFFTWNKFHSFTWNGLDDDMIKS